MNCMGPVEQKRFQVRLSSDDVDSLKVNVSPSFTELLVSVGGVSVLVFAVVMILGGTLFLSRGGVLFVSAM